MKKLYVLLAMFLACMAASGAADGGREINLWKNGAPTKSADVSDTAKVYVYLPKKAKATGRAVVICPGGGYGTLSMGHEGHDWAEWFCGQGIAAVVLKYRLPHGRPEVAVEDAEEAVRLVRRNAAAWDVKPGRVGIVGFSAGGHLASVVATQATGPAMPDFQILFYPVITMDPGFTHRGSMENFLGKNPGKKLVGRYSSDMQVTRVTPRAFIALADDDHVVLPANGANYYLECYRHDVPATLHIYPDGGHGWGMKRSFPYQTEMLLDLKAWLGSF